MQLTLFAILALMNCLHICLASFLMKTPWTKIIVCTLNVIHTHLDKHHCCPARLQTNSMQSILKTIEKVLSITAFSTRMNNFLNKLIYAINSNSYCLSKITNLIRYIAVDQPKGKTMQKHSWNCLQMQVMLNKMLLFHSKTILIKVVHSHKMSEKESILKINHLICNKYANYTKEHMQSPQFHSTNYDGNQLT